MKKLVVFNTVTVDGYFASENGDISWAHRDDNDAEWSTFVAENAKGGGLLLFGRITYQMMASYWPTPHALETMPALAERMNNLPKVVFSRTLEQATWSHTRLLQGDLVAEVRRLKEEGNEDITILGSGSIVSQLTQAGLIDEYQIALTPVVLGKGRTMFEGVTKLVNLKRTSTRSFKNGSVVLSYEPIAISNA
jgi:dihydrofolate reductase